MPEEDYEGIPRNKISWDPKIDYDKCIAAVNVLISAI